MQESHPESLGERGVSINSPAPRETASPVSEKSVPLRDSIAPTPSPSSEPRTSSKYSSLQIWINRLAMILFVSLCAIFGVLLVVLPWTPKWTDNYVLISYPNLHDFLENGFVRGMCTGLGLLDIWIGFSEATNYREPEAQP